MGNGKIRAFIGDLIGVVALFAILFIGLAAIHTLDDGPLSQSDVQEIIGE